MTPPRPPPLSCPKCASQRIILNGAIPDAGAGYLAGGVSHIAVYTSPEPGPLAGYVHGALRARVCAECGYTEFYAENRRVLWDAYQKQIGEKPESTISLIASERVKCAADRIYGLLAFVSSDHDAGPGPLPPPLLPQRFNVEAWSELNGRAVVPWPILRLTVPTIAARIGAETVMAEWVKREHRGFLWTSVEETRERVVAWDELMQTEDLALATEYAQLPQLLRFRVGDEQRLLITARHGAQTHGSLPKNEGVTLTCFSAKPMDTELKAIFTAAATSTGSYKIVTKLHA